MCKHNNVNICTIFIVKEQWICVNLLIYVYNVLLTCQLDIVDAVIQLLLNILHYPLIYPTFKMII